MLKIYGADLSAPVIKVKLVANLLNLEYEYNVISVRDGEHQKEEYLKMHPAGKVPVIDDGGFVLFESDAISRYLARKNNSPLYPNDLKEQAVVDQWMDFTTIHVGGAMGRVLFNKMFAPIINVPVDEQSLQDGQKFLNRFLPVIDAQLGKSQNLAQDAMTIADTTLLATLDPVEVAEIDISKYKNIITWRENLRKQDFYTKVHKNYQETLDRVFAPQK